MRKIYKKCYGLYAVAQEINNYLNNGNMESLLLDISVLRTSDASNEFLVIFTVK